MKGPVRILTESGCYMVVKCICFLISNQYNYNYSFIKPLYLSFMSSFSLSHFLRIYSLSFQIWSLFLYFFFFLSSLLALFLFYFRNLIFSFFVLYPLSFYFLLLNLLHTPPHLVIFPFIALSLLPLLLNLSASILLTLFHPIALSFPFTLLVTFSFYFIHTPFSIHNFISILMLTYFLFRIFSSTQLLTLLSKQFHQSQIPTL